MRKVCKMRMVGRQNIFGPVRTVEGMAAAGAGRCPMARPRRYPPEVDLLVKELYLAGVRLVVHHDRVEVIGRLPPGYRSRLRQCEALLRGIHSGKVIALPERESSVRQLAERVMERNRMARNKPWPVNDGAKK